MEKKIKDLLKEIESTKLVKIDPITLPENLKKLNETKNLNGLSKKQLEEVKNLSSKCIKCDKTANYKIKDDDILLCWKHSIFF